MKQMSEENQQLVYFRNKDVEHKQYSKALEELNGMLSQKLRAAMNENGIVRLRTKIQFEENKEEVSCKQRREMISWMQLLAFFQGHLSRFLFTCDRI